MTFSPGYSAAWFHAFADSVPAELTALEVDAIARLAPPVDHPRLLDVGCGVGRVASRLAHRGYQVTGIDASVDALRRARLATPGGRFVGLDAKHVGHVRWTFDAAISMWNSIGFGTRDEDVETVAGLGRVLRPGGRLMLDLYHPDWLAAHEQGGVADARGVTIDRWLDEGRSCHRFRYADGTEEDIQFNVYRPDEIAPLLRAAGLRPEAYLVWWKTDQAPSAECARYQIVAVREARTIRAPEASRRR
jgi:SAM-dependent methyltransferase